MRRVEQLLDSRDDIQSRCCAGFENRNQHTALAILADHVGLHGKPVTHAGHSLK